MTLIRDLFHVFLFFFVFFVLFCFVVFLFLIYKPGITSTAGYYVVGTEQ